MATLLLIIIYILAIGLGVPDSAFGSAWPAIYPDLGLDISMANFVSALVSCGTVISSLFSARIINRFGTAAVTAVSTAMTAIALFGYSASPNIWFICLLALPLGLGAGAIDTAINNYMSLHYSAMYMNFMHCFYGVGVMISPYIMSWALKLSTWRFGYILVAATQAIIALIAILAVPLWKKVSRAKTGQNTADTKTLGIFQMIRSPGIVWASVFFMASTSIEALCTVWSSTYMVHTKGFSASASAGYLVLYYLGLTSGRILAGLLVNKLSTWTNLKLGIVLGFCGVVTLFFAQTPALVMTGLFLIGCGVAPIFPGLVFLTPENFGEDVSQSVTGFEMAAAYVGTLASPVLFGLFAGAVSTYAFPFFLLFFEVMVTIANVALICALKKSGKA
ncbi:MAG: MFS transporter [Ruminococcaceae bacterium]|nr:MFS transporter [Oscillospiraceae bacterium]